MLSGHQPVGDDQQRLAPHQPCQCRLDDRLIFRVSVEVASSKMTMGASFHGTGNGDTLPLTAGQVTAGCTAYGLIAVLQPHYELVAAVLRGVNDLRIGRSLPMRILSMTERSKGSCPGIHRRCASHSASGNVRMSTPPSSIEPSFTPKGGDKPGDGGLSAAGGAKSIDCPGQCADRFRAVPPCRDRQSGHPSVGWRYRPAAFRAGRCISSDSTSATRPRWS